MGRLAGFRYRGGAAKLRRFWREREIEACGQLRDPRGVGDVHQLHLADGPPLAAVLDQDHVVGAARHLRLVRGRGDKRRGDEFLAFLAPRDELEQRLAVGAQ